MTSAPHIFSLPLSTEITIKDPAFPPPNMPGQENDEIYEVENILDHRVKGLRKTNVEYLIKWKNYSEDHNTWESEDDVMATRLVRRYWDNLKTSQQGRGRGRGGPGSRGGRGSRGGGLGSRGGRGSRGRGRGSRGGGRGSRGGGRGSRGGGRGSRGGGRGGGRAPDAVAATAVESIAEAEVTDNQNNEQMCAVNLLSTVNILTSLPPPSFDDAGLDSHSEEDESLKEKVVRDLDFRSELTFDWQTQIKGVEAVMKEGPILYGIVRWDDNVLAMYPTDLISRRCAQKLIDYYEKLL